jgi:hypothetical protein
MRGEDWKGDFFEERHFFGGPGQLISYSGDGIFKSVFLIELLREKEKCCFLQGWLEDERKGERNRQNNGATRHYRQKNDDQSASVSRSAVFQP